MSNKKLYKIISIISYYTILLYILFLKWAMNASVAPVILISFFILFFLNIKNINNDKKQLLKNIIVIFLFLIYILLNMLLTYEHSFLYENIINATLYPIISSLYFVYLLKNEKNFLKKYIITPSFFLLNIYFVVNFFIVLKQVSSPGFMIRNFTMNDFYLDHISGLLGANGTPRLMLFNIVCLNLNISQLNSENKKIAFLSKIMFVLVLAGSCYVSLLNDSRMYYMLLVLFLFPTFIKYIIANSNFMKLTTKKIKIFITILMAVIGMLLLYNFNDTFKTTIDEKFIDNYINRSVQNMSSSGNEERVELFKLAINEGDGLKFGRGIGSMHYNGEGYVKHFGLNDFNVRVYSGGLLYILVLLLIYINIYEIILGIKPNQYFIKSYYFVLLIILGLYTQVYTYCDKNILLSLIFMTTSYAQIKKKNG